MATARMIVQIRMGTRHTHDRRKYPVNIIRVSEKNRRCLAVALAAFLTMVFASVSAERPASFHESVQAVILHDDPAIVIDNVRIVDGTGAPAREKSSVLIENGRISAISTAGKIRNAGAVRIDATGKTLLPGFVMMHEHLIYLNPTGSLPSYTSEHLPMPPLYLAAGTTTMRTTGTVNANDDLQVKQLIDDGRVPGPRLFVTAPFIEGPGSFAYQLRPNLTADDVRLFVRYWVNAGATSFKAYMNVSQEVLGAAIDEAHNLGATVTGHLCSVTFEEASALGIDNLEHGLYVSSDIVPDKVVDKCPSLPRADRIRLMNLDNPIVRKLIDTLVERNVAITSTLPVFAAGLHPAIPTQESLAMLSPRSRLMAEERWIGFLRSADTEATKERQTLLKREMEFEKAFVDAGGTLLVGTDPTGWGGTVPPNSTHAALILLVNAGFTPLEALSLATKTGAEFLGIDKQVGTIEAGKNADLVLVAGEPDKEISSIQNVSMVFRDGVAYDPVSLIDSVRGKVGR
jgi:imidazolonepropionase-like amidohydrolase